MKMKPFALAIAAVVLLSSLSLAGEQDKLKDRKARDSYSLGYTFGHNLAGQEVEIDKDILVAAVRDALEGKEPLLGLNEIRDTVNELRRKAVILQGQRTRELAAKNLEEATSFLEGNKKKEGVITLPSGLQYKVIKEGKGANPKETDGVRMRYRGTLANGAEFDNTMDLADNDVPVIPVVGAHKGWAEALQLMKPGSMWRLFVPPQLGYGEQRVGRVPPNSVLIYELELLSVVDRSAAEKTASAAPAEASAAGPPDSGAPGRSGNN